MITVEELTPAWRDAFLVSRNSLFTPVDAAYCDRVENPASPFPMRTFIGHDTSKVVSWASFFIREFDLGRVQMPAISVAMACAVGTLPEYRRQGLGEMVWRAAEKFLATEVDGFMVYTGEGGNGYSFYRAMGAIALFFPRSLRLTVSPEPHAGETGTPTASFVESSRFTPKRGAVFADCYYGFGGFIAGRPSSLDRWADTSFFYDPNTIGCVPQISWLENPETGEWEAYAIWAGPIEKVGWKKGAVEIWELGCLRRRDPEFLRCLLQPACAAARDGGGSVDWWAVPDHPLAEQMIEVGFKEMPRSLCLLGRLFDPAWQLADQLRTRGLTIELSDATDRRVDIRVGGTHVEIEFDAVTRMILGRSTATQEYQHGLLTTYPSCQTLDVLTALDVALPRVPWSYFASEYI